MREQKEKEPAVPLMRAKDAIYEIQRRRWMKQLQPEKALRDMEQDPKAGEGE